MIEKLVLKDEYFGDFLPYLKQDTVTDIEWNGRFMKIKDLKKGTYTVKEILTEEFQEQFATRLSNLINKPFNKSTPRLEAETENLRITIIDPSVAISGMRINIRKTEAKVRMNEESVINDKYCDVVTLELMKTLVLSHCSGVIIGTTGSGKTELEKFLAQYTPNLETIITLEDSAELRLAKIYPKKDVTELRVNNDFSNTDGIEYALRANAEWLLMAEARSDEANKVIECASTSCVVITCIHCDDVKNIPDRFDNMIASKDTSVESKENDVYAFFDFGIKVVKKEEEGKPIQRYIEQLCIFERNNHTNTITMLIDNGTFTGNSIPTTLLQRFKKYNCVDPLNSLKR